MAGAEQHMVGGQLMALAMRLEPDVISLQLVCRAGVDRLTPLVVAVASLMLDDEAGHATAMVALDHSDPPTTLLRAWHLMPSSS